MTSSATWYDFVYLIEYKFVTMNLNNLTIKAQEAIQKAQQYAMEENHQAIEVGHILKGTFAVEDSPVSYILKKLGFNPDIIKRAIDSITSSYAKSTSDSGSVLSRPAAEVIQKANINLKQFNDEYVAIEHLLLAILQVKDQVGQMLKDNGIKEADMIAAIKDLRKGSKVNSQSAENTYNALNKYAINLNEKAKSGKLDPVIGREEEIRRVLHILARRTKNNPILIGEPGVGKTAIIEGLAHRIVAGDVPEDLREKQIFALDMGALIAGAKYQGEFEERLKSVVNEVVSSDGGIYLFIDEIHTLIGAGKNQGAMDAANILKPALARGELRAIGATTLDEYQKYFEKDKALERRFQSVMADEPSIEDTISILRGLKERYETHHKINITDEAVVAAVQLSHRYITERFLPDKAIDLIDEAAAKLRLEMNSMPEELDEVERKIRQLEIERAAMQREEDKVKLEKINADLANLEDTRNVLRAKWESEKNVVLSIQAAKENIEKLKLESVKAEREGNFSLAAEIKYGKIPAQQSLLEESNAQLDQMQKNEKLLVKEEVDSEDIAEIVSKWTGIPVTRMLQSERSKLLDLESQLQARVVGQDEALEAAANAIRLSRTGLSNENRPIGSFLFLGTTGVGKTELAKALAEVLFDDENLLTRIDMSEYQEKHSVSRLVGAPPGYVGYDEGGQLTEAVRRKPYSVILLDEIEKAHPDTFNILLQVLEDGRLTDNKGRVANFKNSIIIMTSNIGSDIIRASFEDLKPGEEDAATMKASDLVFQLLKQSVRPEFLNRIDEVIMFRPLSKNNIKSIIEIQLKHVVSMLAKQDIDVKFSSHIKDWLAEEGYSPEFGARPLKRVITKKLLNEISKQILMDKIRPNSSILIDEFDGKIVVRQPEVVA
jgi:ATP-dependent Clp protease ATP-binding subunit ClpB